MADKKLTLGGTGETVRANLQRLRGGMQYKDLSARLTELGNPIPPLGLRRIENGERRVTVDDLCALAVALDVSPLTLLLPGDGSRYAASMLTGVPDREVSHNTQWLWGLGEEPLELPGSGMSTDDRRAIALFHARARPHVDTRGTISSASWDGPGQDEETQDAELLGRADADLGGLEEAQGLNRRRGDH